MRSRLYLSLGINVALLAVAATSSGGAEINVTNDQKHRWGESQIAVNPRNPKNIVFATVGTGFTNDCQAHSPACEMVTADFGVGMPFPQARGIFTVPDFTVVAAFVSFDRGKTWKLQKSGVTADLTAGSATSDKVCWVAGKAGTLLLTTDGGKRWKQLPSPISEDLGGIHATDALHASIWDVPNRKSFETTDGGATWNPISIK